MINMSEKVCNSKSQNRNDTEESEIGDYKPKISSHSNYQRFLRLTHDRSGSLSEDDGNLSGGEGFIEDEFSIDDSIVEEDLYPDLSSPDYEGDKSPSGDAPAPVEPPTEEQRAEWLEELEKVEGEIGTLRQVLGAKVRYSADLKRKLGVTPLQELKQDFQLGVKTIRDSDTYQKTNEKLHQLNEKLHQSTAYQKTSAAAKSAAEKTSSVVSGIGTSVSKKLGDIRNSQTFKSVEGRMESAYATVKAKVSGSRSEGNFEEALESEKAMESNGNSTTPVTSQPEEKVPL